MGWLFAAFAFALGAVLGSFINVVAYRTPRGISLVHPGSRCPVCGVAIRARDNIPVASWLLLHGRCRDCGASISPRYAVVEILLGVLFLLLYFVEVPSDGLLSQGIRVPAEFKLPIDRWPWEGLGRFLYRSGLLSATVALLLIDVDRQWPPRRLIGWMLLLAIVPLLLWPQLHPAARAEPAGAIMSTGQSLLACVVGVAAGAVVGAVLGFSAGRVHDAARQRSMLIAALALVGVGFGWQIALTAAAIGALLLVAWRGLTWIPGVTIRMSPLAAIIPPLVFARPLESEVGPLAVPQAVLLAAGLLITAALSALAGRLPRNPS